MSYRHAIVWLDHRRATIVEFSAAADQVSTITSETIVGKLHQKSGKMGSGHLPDDLVFFDQVVTATKAPEILIVGPGTAKRSFERYVQNEHPEFAKRIFGVETSDHPSHGQLLAMGRKFFKRVDQLH